MLITLLRRAPNIWSPNNMAKIKTFAFLDLETTGLPLFEGNTTKITELTIVAVLADHLSLGVVPRVQHKLTLCFNPWKLVTQKSEELTGLSNESLEHLAPFTPSTVDTINCFLEHTPQPICFVAHNGSRFDYPILRAHIQKTDSTLMESVLCIDSIDAFKELEEKMSVADPEPMPLEFDDGFNEILIRAVDEYYENQIKPPQQINKKPSEIQKLNETTPEKQPKLANLKHVQAKPAGAGSSRKCHSATTRRRLAFNKGFKLGEVYERLTKQRPVVAHQAECDVAMLVQCAAKLGNLFIDWANRNSKRFLDVPEMVPGRKIGY